MEILFSVTTLLISSFNIKDIFKKCLFFNKINKINLYFSLESKIIHCCHAWKISRISCCVKPGIKHVDHVSIHPKSKTMQQ